MDELNTNIYNNVEDRNNCNSNNFLSNVLQNNNIIWVILILIFLIFFCQKDNNKGS